jgi:hypothetical protein
MTGDTSVYLEFTPPERSATGWTGSDLLVGTSLIVLLVALFMPWFSGTENLAPNGGSRVLASADGPSAHGYVWFVFALTIIALIVLVAREAISRVPGNVPSPEQILLVATGLALLLTILAAVIKPSPGFGVVGQTLQLSSAAPVSIGWSYGGFVAVAAAVVAFVVVFRAGSPRSSGRGLGHTVRRQPGGAG